MHNLKWEQMSDEAWERIETLPMKKKKPSPYDSALQAIIDGQIICLPVEDDKHVRGIRIGIGRRASNTFHVKPTFKYDARRKILAIRLAPDRPTPEAQESEEPGKRKPGRPRKASRMSYLAHNGAVTPLGANGNRRSEERAPGPGMVR